ncbi:hypothetical protein D9758_011493 [Tetrapyrgos nigripes]|uniref:RNA exonuclease 4 n=1 Tax=Tetrapyrgos nigripes TaxID=182062 RepID=A0A8H5CSK3_9AGAR|nr:hypothetical protein D9758_011493 [Tetrapyrgos nigripes]
MSPVHLLRPQIGLLYRRKSLKRQKSPHQTAMDMVKVLLAKAKSYGQFYLQIELLARLRTRLRSWKWIFKCSGSSTVHRFHAEGSVSHSENASAKDRKNGESLAALRDMIAGRMEYTEAQKLPGKYLALDCEIVGVGIDGSESSLAGVSLVNFHGAVILDEFVKQRERVVDYRTQWSGVRESDMVKDEEFVLTTVTLTRTTKSFDEIQKQVANLIKDRILIGYAIYNDLKVLLLSHPRPLIRDTQYFAGKYKVVKSKYVALRNLVKQELDVSIQQGEHSSLTDARATMAVYRLHRKEWEKSSLGIQAATLLPANAAAKGKTPEPAGDGELDGRDNEKTKKKDKHKEKRRKAPADEEDDDDDDDENADGRGLSSGLSSKSSKKPKKQKEFPGGGRKGVSSGLSTVVRRKGKAESDRGKARGGAAGPGSGASQKNSAVEDPWWKELGGSDSGSGGTSAKGSEFSLRL